MITTLTVWTINILYLFSLLSQAYKTHRRGSVAGVNPATTWMLWNGYAFYTIYAYGQPLPLAYKMCVPLWFVAATTLMVQKLYHDTGIFWFGVYEVNHIIIALYFGLSLVVPELSLYAGWIAVLFWTVKLVPQIYQNMCKKSAHGVDLGFVAMSLIGATLEVGYASTFHLPLPTLLNAVRSAALSALLMWQYMAYGTKQRRIRRQPARRQRLFVSHA